MWHVSCGAHEHEQTRHSEEQKQVTPLSPPLFLFFYFLLKSLLFYAHTVCVYVRSGLGPAKEGDPQYVVVHCSGYIRSWPPAGNARAHMQEIALLSAQACLSRVHQSPGS